MKYIIVEDEPKAAEVLQRYIERIPVIQLLGSFRTVKQAVTFLSKNDVDVVLLDINLPDQSGFQLLETINKKPQIIFTTAYSEYAVQSYELEAIDYLLKPITFERFEKAVDKLKRTVDLIAVDEMVNLKSGNQIHRIAVADILYLEKSHNYFIVHTEHGKMLIRETMKQIFGILSPSLFIRVHKSYIVAIKHISVIERDQLFVRKQKIPIGQMYKTEVMNRIHSK